MRSLLVFLFFLALAALFTRPLALDLRGTLPVGPDPSHIFHPFAGTVLHSDLSLGTAVLVAPLRLFVHDPVPRPVVNGAGAFTPLGTAALDRQVRHHWLRRAPGDVDTSKPTAFLRHAFDARYLILPTGRRYGLGHLASALDRSLDFRLVAKTEDGDRIYEIVRVTVEGQGGRP